MRTGRDPDAPRPRTRDDAPDDVDTAIERASDDATGGASDDVSQDGRVARAWRRNRVGVVGVVAGVLTALLVLLAGGVVALTRSPQWSADTQVLVSPGPLVAKSDIPAYYETLSRGQVVATAARLVGRRGFTEQAARAVGVAPSSVTSRAAVVPGTALVSVAVTAPSEAQSEWIADGIVRRSLPAVNGLLDPYRAQRLGSAAGSSEPAGLSTGQLVAVIVLVAVVTGVGVQQVVHQRALARRRE